MTQGLIILGALVFMALGLLHGILTLRDLRHPRTFTPRDPALRQAMQQSSIALHPTINLWKAWLGFNLSHSLGILMFASAYLDVGIFAPQLFAQSLLLQGCAVVISAIYLILSLGFWFSKPAIGSAVALACFLIAAVLARF
jgi:hypothetical protein